MKEMFELEDGRGLEVWSQERLRSSNHPPRWTMLSSPWFLALILAIAGVVGFLYFSQVFRPLIDTYRRASLNNDPESRTIDPSVEHQEAESLVSEPMVPELLLRLIRVAQSERWITCLFVNEGRLIMNLSVTADHGVAARIDPTDLLKPKQAGSIKLQIPPHRDAKEIGILIRYESAKGHLCKEVYRLLIAEKTWSRAQDAEVLAVL